MPTQEERLTILEYDLKQYKTETIKAYGEMAIEMTMVKELSEDVVKRLASLKTEIEQRFGRVDTRLDAMDAHLGSMHTRLDQLETRFNRMDTCLDRVDSHLESMETRFNRMDTRLDQMGTGLDRVDTHLGSMNTRLDRVENMLAQVLARLPENP